MRSRLSRAAVALLLLAAAAAAPVGGFSAGHFSVLPAGGAPLHHSFVSRPAAAPPSAQDHRDSPVYFISVSSPAGTPGVGFIAEPPVRDPFFTVSLASNGRPAGLYQLPPYVRARLGRRYASQLRAPSQRARADTDSYRLVWSR